MIFKNTDIRWLKNVKKDDGTAWAYFEADINFEFKLNFSIDQIKGAKEVKPGEIILLFQRLDRISGISPRTYLTHLVTPVDNKLEKNSEINHRFNWERKVIVVAKAFPKNSIYTNASNLNFFKANRGKVCSIKLLSETKSQEEIQQEVWRLFTGHFNEKLENDINEYDESSNNQIIDEEDFSVLEGREIEELRTHKRRERNPIIVELAKKRALVNGRIFCECCNFDFKEIYGDVGTGFIECHHKLPIAKGGERKTKIEDLAVVCANCHRMLHRKNNKGKYFSVKELKLILNHNS